MKEFERLGTRYRSSLADMKFRMEQLEAENDGSVDTGKRILELAQKAASLYSTQISAEKRKLLVSVYSNPKWTSSELAPNYRQTFDMFAETNSKYQRKKATFLAKSDLIEVWRPRDNEIENWEITLNIGKILPK